MLVWIIPLSILIFFELVADIFAKQFSLNSTWYWALFAILGYVFANTAWLVAIKNGSGLGRGAVIFSVASAVIAVAIGYFLYNETISKTQTIGVILGVVALILIFWE